MRYPTSSERLFHVSESGGLSRFEPRADARGRRLVWAIGAARLHNYLLPRDCPRISYYATATTSDADRTAFFSADSTESVIAIEHGWLSAVASTPLYVYEFDPQSFRLDDAAAGYYVAAQAVTPIDCRYIAAPLQALLERPIELRVLSSLLPLRDRVVASSLGFSIIRLRNARGAA
jgi:Family of unknown function (DUF6886)